MDEFMRLVGSIGLKSDAEMEQEFEDALRFFDKDGRGLINGQYLKSVLQSRGRTEVLRQGRSRTDQRTVSQVSAAVSRTH